MTKGAGLFLGRLHSKPGVGRNRRHSPLPCNPGVVLQPTDSGFRAPPLLPRQVLHPQWNLSWFSKQMLLSLPQFPHL